MSAPAALHEYRDRTIIAANMPKEHHDSCRKAMDRLWEEHHPDGADLFSDPDPDDWCTVFGFVCGYAACLEDQNTREKAETIEKPKDIGID